MKKHFKIIAAITCGSIISIGTLQMLASCSSTLNETELISKISLFNINDLYNSIRQYSYKEYGNFVDNGYFKKNGEISINAKLYNDASKTGKPITTLELHTNDWNNLSYADWYYGAFKLVYQNESNTKPKVDLDIVNAINSSTKEQWAMTLDASHITTQKFEDNIKGELKAWSIPLETNKMNFIKFDLVYVNDGRDVRIMNSDQSIIIYVDDIIQR